MRFTSRFAVLLCLWGLASSFALAQPGRRIVAVGELRAKVFSGEGTRSQILSLDSRLLRRKVFFSVVLPTSYDDNDKSQNGRIYPALYLLHGLTGRFDNWTGKTDLAKQADKYNLIIVTPEGGDGWYTDSATVPDDKYESYFFEEIIPEVDGRFRTIADKRGRAVAGLSMGGYGAIKFGLKYPHMFFLVGSFSGALGAASVTEKEFGPGSAITKTILSVFGKEDSLTRKANDVFQLLRSVPAEKIKDLPYIYQSCGTEDFLFQNNRDFNALLVQRKVRHEYHQVPGTHNWEFWTSEVKVLFEVLLKR